MILTERLIVREFATSDITEDYLSALNDKCLQKFSRNQYRTHSYQSSLEYLKSFAHTSNYFFAAVSSHNSSLIGTCTCFYTDFHRRYDIGMMILPQFHHCGYASELLNSVARFLFATHDLIKITAGTPSTHKAMISVLRSSDFNLEAQIPNQFLTIDGDQLTVNYYARYS